MNIKNKILTILAKQRPINLEMTYTEPKEEMAGKTALVIGGGNGIGYAIAERLRQSGCRVIIAGRNEYHYQGHYSEIWDVSKTEKISEKIDELIEKYGEINIVVNSQGLCPENDFRQNTYEIDIQDFEDVFKVNLESVYFICQGFCKYFEKNQINGHILNIASTEGLKGTTVPYGISKAAVVSMTKGFGKKMAQKGIVINGIAPGATFTSMMRVGSGSDLRLNRIPSGRMTAPREIAEAAMLMLGDTGNQMCGEILVIDGGESLH